MGSTDKTDGNDLEQNESYPSPDKIAHRNIITLIEVPPGIDDGVQVFFAIPNNFLFIKPSLIFLEVLRSLPRLLMRSRLFVQTLKKDK